ncbi:MAG TPA: ATP-binding protein [Leptospiraceae bacterium]|nr:ATP-binding protein [Leptospiraceae bacterium]HRG77113.1 ATP-binding protein [Leptospiraceae bacterium]
MILDGILKNIKTGDYSCPYCKGVGIVLDEMITGSRTGSLGLCSCVTEHCVKCPAKAKAPYLVYEESLNKMIPCFCQEARLTRNRLDKIIDASNIPPRYKYRFLNSMDVSGNNMISLFVAHDWANELINNWDNPAHWKDKPKQGMYLSGGTGSGKTLLACIILNELIFRYGVKCRYAKISKDFLNALKDTYQKDSEYHGQERSIEMEFADIDVLVIDDFGVQKDSDWVNSKLYDLIDSRYEKEKITLLTSNSPLSDWKEKGEGRVYSRLCEMTHEIKLECPDYRLKFQMSTS